MIASTYIISLALWPPWIIAWPYIEVHAHATHSQLANVA